MSAAQVAGTLFRFPGGEHIAQGPTTDALRAHALEWHSMAQMHHFNARVALARGDYDAAANELVHELGKVQQTLAIVKELRGHPRGKRQVELDALQLVLGAVSGELAFLPGVTADDTANTLEAQAERVDNVQARLLTMAEGYRLNAAADRDESPE